MTEAKDSKGQPVAVGDSVVVRGRVLGVFENPAEFVMDAPTLLRVEWETDAPLIDFVKSASVTKE